ncbi:MAG: UDP-3-O-(3-hydroxymyristoyl)glucosamine N-acyltransferase [Phycisphaerae bacterium]
MRLAQLCDVLTEAGFPARLDGEDREVRAVNTLEDASEGEVSFLSNPKYLPAVGATGASAVIVQDHVDVPDSVAAIRCADPYAAVTVAIIKLHGYRKHPQWGISARASIDPTATIGRNVNVGPGATIAAQATVGDGCTIYPGCYIGDEVGLGTDCILYPNVVIYDYCELGDRVTIHAGSVIGEDGLGYAPHDGRWIKIPQVGRVILGDDVEIGANCSIDRATLGQTEIGAGTKFGNDIVVGHGTKIGRDCLFVGQVGIAGSVTVGRHVTLAGQVGVAGHLTIGDDARIGAQSGIAGDVPPKADLLGSPAIPIEKAKRALYVVQNLPDWVKRIKDLERELADLREQDNAREPC